MLYFLTATAILAASGLFLLGAAVFLLTLRKVFTPKPVVRPPWVTFYKR